MKTICFFYYLIEMDQLITFEGEAEYIVVNTGLTPLVTLASCSTHNLESVPLEKHQPEAVHCSVITEDIVITHHAEDGVPDEGHLHESQPVAFDSVQPVPSTSATTQHPNKPIVENTMDIMHNYSSRSQATCPLRIESYRCYQCKLRFASETKAIAHFKSTHSRLMCHHCRLIQFENYPSYVNHIKESHIECPLCEALIKHRIALQKHLSRYHPNRQSRLKAACGEQNCSAHFAKLPELITHLRVCTIQHKILYTFIHI